MILLPPLPRGSSLTTRLVRVGGDLVSTLGGPTQRITRIGSRFAADVQLPTLDAECAGRWLACPLRAEALGETLGLIVPQVQDVSGQVGNTGTGASGSAAVTYTGPAPVVGMAFSVAVGGRNYLHTVTDLPAAGQMRVAPLLRVAIAATPLEFVAPVLEGFVGETEWSTEFFRFVGHAFTITESA
jgi:hypothetical protein